MKKQTWLIVCTACVLSFVLLLSGFVMSVRDVANPPETDLQVDSEPERDTETADNGTFTLVALGDSLTRGTGDQSGKGYVGVLKESLEKEKGKVIVHNHGVRGATLSELLEQLKEKEIRRTVEKASVITVTIGGNDLFNEGKPLEHLDLAAMKDIQETAAQHINELFAAIRSVNQEAPVLYVGLYNPFPDLGEAKAYAKIVHEWNYEVTLKANEYENIAVVPTFDIIRDPDEDLYSDHFHPNSKSYERIAERMVGLIE